MNSTPLTVLMAVRNGEPYLEAAVESILGQTFGDFRFLIVDDCSTDRTSEILRSYNDSRIDLVRLDRNVGQTAALSLGLERITTPWIARMDADDYSAATRFQHQMDLLNADRSIGCVGTHAWIFLKDPKRAESLLIRPETHAEIAHALVWDSPVIHGSIIVSRQALLKSGGYNKRYPYLADLDLYDRLIECCRFANIPRPLLGIRRHAGQGSMTAAAIEEGIQIYSGRLSSNRYSREQRGVLRGALSLYLLRRALVGLARRDWPRLVANAARAFATSPQTVIRFSLPHSLRQSYCMRMWKLSEKRFNPPKEIEVA